MFIGCGEFWGQHSLDVGKSGKPSTFGANTDLLYLLNGFFWFKSCNSNAG